VEEKIGMLIIEGKIFSPLVFDHIKKSNKICLGELR